MLVILAFIGMACDKVIDVDNELKADINGESFSALATVGVKESGLILITGTAGTKNVVVAMDADITPGDYEMISGKAYATYTDGSESFTVAASGKVSITKHDTEDLIVEGTFTGTIKTQLDSTSTTEITNGSFVSTYKEI